jgi:hypothetical protein
MKISNVEIRVNIKISFFENKSGNILEIQFVCLRAWKNEKYIHKDQSGGRVYVTVISKKSSINLDLLNSNKSAKKSENVQITHNGNIYSRI